MDEFLQTIVDKFTFKVATDRLYSREGIWALESDGRVRIGLSDYLQQSSGDVAFADVKPEGTELSAGDEVAVIETIKVNISIISPISGKIVRVNAAMETEPELINSDPYGKGWLAEIEASDWQSEKASLMDPQAYFTQMKGQAEEEALKP